MKLLSRMLFAGAVFASTGVVAHGPVPRPLQNVPVPPVPGLLDGTDPIVVDKQKAIALGKALFWDVNVGSDGMACGSCHFHAGADARVKNQINPGEKGTLTTSHTFEALPSGSGTGGPNYSLTKRDFPLYQFNDPLDRVSGEIFSTDDVVSSSGTFTGEFKNASRFSGKNDDCARSADAVFHANGVGTRRVEPRNAPTVINSVFNHRNFWDGRANNIFNGSSLWGERDTRPETGVWVKTNARSVSLQRLHLKNSSLASLATAPPLSDSEMACRHRSWQDIGRKLLLRQPLQSQKVHPEDSVLGALSLSTPGNLKPGLNTTYRTLITQAFSSKYWSYSGTGPFGGRPGQPAYNQIEANFPMFFGIALQLYQSTLISDQSPFDLSEVDPENFYYPTFGGLGYSEEKRAQLVRGFEAFHDHHCNVCHGGPLLTVAAIKTDSELVTPTPGATFGPSIPYGSLALGPNGASAVGISRFGNLLQRDDTTGGTKLMDIGFVNTAVADALSDPGLAGVDDFGNPLSFADQYVSYLRGKYNLVKDPGVNTTRACDFVSVIGLNSANTSPTVFTNVDGVQEDGSREGALRNQNCLRAAGRYIPTIAAAEAAVTAQPAKLAVAKQAAFKIPTLRNIELTGPYMHNGSMATLEQVVEFYARRNNLDFGDKHSFSVTADGLALPGNASQREDLIEFLKSLTDDRVRYEMAPFDHPEIVIPNGHTGNSQSVSTDKAIAPGLAKDDFITIPAVGRNGANVPIQPFDALLAP